MSFFQLPSSIQLLESEFLSDHYIELSVKRDDLIHPEISGNKWRKLKYNFKTIKEQSITKVLTFGGAFSNHIIATAAAGNYFGVETIGVIRGERPEKLSDTLTIAEKYGMRLHFVSRSVYREKESKQMIRKLKEQFGDFYLIPEGGANQLAVSGCAEIVNEINQDFDCISVAAGTGTTAAGILQSIEKERLMVFPVLKGVSYLKDEILKYQTSTEKKEQLEFIDQYHLGGYAKVNKDLIRFTNEFYKSYQVKLDLIYTAKHFYGLFDLISKNYFQRGTKIIALHTGGLQGNVGMEKRYQMKLFQS